MTGKTGKNVRRAVVLGGSIAGLLAARALSEAYDEVVVVDRDELTDLPENRRGVPQGRHVHGILARGQQIIEEYFPGITEELEAAGAVTGDVAGNVRWIMDGIPMSQGDSGLLAVSVARPTLEAHIRHRVRALANVEILDRREVVGLRFAPVAHHVTGVRTVDRRDPGGTSVVDAELVVDTMGRGSQVPRWLKDHGWPGVPEDRTQVGLTYTTRHYRAGPEPSPGDISVDIVATPDNPRGAICARIDGERQIVTAYGILGDVPPTDPEGFLDFLKSLSSPEIYEALVVGREPLDAPVSYRFPASLRRRYERLDRFPTGLLVMGDAVCSFNPTYGQGMTVAALGSVVLRAHATGDGPPDPVAYFRDLARDAVDEAWRQALSNDLGFPGVEGDRTPEILADQEYIGLVLEAAQRDGEVAAAYARVIGLVDPPEALRSPRVREALKAD
ncbi:MULTISPECIES: FAD-binding monooxygenase [unclassified Streptomyces]|uniref:FAD-dependent oxidoreductase n=1 Tax=unclassified Streptomyces TaxID=2593676 RepID=UPI00081EC0DE|nr:MULTISPECIES: FAD-binding monooxygenase [unclassified Streptomyces]MYZ36095.1 FAD-binding monooxygenase [Streptomyces sp. SID4917]SCF80851.1 2-polyprenyl-6-methoxyphenol hydroxylase [Streptomyces sp. MnatMP-M17]